MILDGLAWFLVLSGHLVPGERRMMVEQLVQPLLEPA